MPDSMELVSILHQRPDYNALLWEKNLRTTAVSAERAGYFPTLSGHFVYNYSASSDQFDIQDRKNSYYFVGVNLQVPIFTGGYTSAQVQKARINLGKSEINIKKTEDDITRSIKNIRLRLNEAYSRIQSADKTRETAMRAFDIAQTSADNGLATQLELKDARVQVEQAVLNYYMATYDYLDAYYEWELATGRAVKPGSIDESGM
jgi:outer membrane protein TolC